MPRSVDALTHEVEFRLGCVQHALASSVAEAAQVFRRAPATVYRWKKAHLTGGVRSLQPKSRRPKQTQKRQWGETSEVAVLRLRQQHRRAGMAKLRVLLLAEGIDLSDSTIGRILTSVKTRNLLIEPITGLRSRRVKPTRPYATRVPEDKRQPSEPGALIQIDTVHIHPPAGCAESGNSKDSDIVPG